MCNIFVNAVYIAKIIMHLLFEFKKNAATVAAFFAAPPEGGLII